MDEWKACGRKASRSLSKDAFPGLLRKLNNSLINKAENLQNGFKKCGIYPFNPQKVFKRLPDYSLKQNDDTNSSTNTDCRVSDAVLGLLRMIRGVDEERPKKRRKKIDIAPGKSITCDDVPTAEEGE